MNKLYFGLLLSLCLTACDTLKHDVGSVQTSYKKSASDTVIYTNIVQILQNLRRDLPADVRIVVLHGRVLLIGYVSCSKEHIDIINAVWQVQGIQEVVDHLEQVDPLQKSGFELKSTLLKTQLDTMFLTNSDVHYGNFQYVIFKKNLYVLASTKSEAEKKAFYNMVKKIPVIQKVFFYSTNAQ